MESAIKGIGIIGAGRRMRRVLKHVLDQVESGRAIRIAAVFDPDPESVKELRAMVDYDFVCASSADAVVGHNDVDWVFIGSWNCFHATQAVAALEAGKDVFCEKPLATTLDECLAVRDAVERTGRRFFFGLVLRYAAHYQKISELINSGVIGRLTSFEFNETLSFNHGGYIFGNWRRKVANAGSHMLEKCCHDLDVANWITGSRPVRVASFGGNDFFREENRLFVEKVGASKDGVPAYRSWPDLHREDPFDGKAELLDNQVVILEYENGVRGTFHSNCNAGIPERRLYLCGTEGALRANLSEQIIQWRRIGWEEEMQDFDSGHSDLHGGGDQIMAAALVRTIFHDDEPLASVDEGISSAITAFGIDRAIQTGGVFDLTPLWEQIGKQEPDGVEHRSTGLEESLCLSSAS